VITCFSSQVGTVQLEFHYLSRVTGSDRYKQKADAIMGSLQFLPALQPARSRPTDVLEKQDVALFTNLISTSKAELAGHVITVGGNVDRCATLGFVLGSSCRRCFGRSLYEYLLKQYLFTNGRDKRARAVRNSNCSNAPLRL